MGYDQRVILSVGSSSSSRRKSGLAGFCRIGLGATWDRFAPMEFTALVNSLIQGNYSETWRIVANHNEGGPIPGPDQPYEIQAAYANHPTAQDWFRGALAQAQSGQFVNPPWPPVGPLADTLQQQAAPAPAPTQTTTYSAPAPQPAYSPPPPASYVAPTAPASVDPSPVSAPAIPRSPTSTTSSSAPPSYTSTSGYLSFPSSSASQAVRRDTPAAEPSFLERTINLPLLGEVSMPVGLGLGAAAAFVVTRLLRGGRGREERRRDD